MNGGTLIVGLGNSLMGSDAIGHRVAEALAIHPRLPADVTVVSGHTDLLRLAEAMRGRATVVVLDAMLDDGEPGRLLRFDVSAPTLDLRQGHAHALSAVQALQLLQAATDALDRTRVIVLAITVKRSTLGSELPAALATRVPALVESVLMVLTATASADAG